MSFRVTGKYLERIKDLRIRREAAALSTIGECNKPGPINDAPDLAEVEKKYSLEIHPDNRSRRLAIFNKKNIELTDCNPNITNTGSIACEF
jgi:hypothetical protein